MYDVYYFKVYIYELILMFIQCDIRIYRAYRYGQTKNVFVYRLLATDSMEDVIYKKQIIKQSLAARIVDAQMPSNHFNDKEQYELINFKDESDTLAMLLIEKAEILLTNGIQDKVLRKFVSAFSSILTSIEDQGSFINIYTIYI